MKRKTSKLSVIRLAAITLIFSQTVNAEIAKPGSYKIDPAHTSVAFTVNHLGTSDLVGRFNILEGNINFTPNGNSHVDMTIETASVDTNHKKRDVHLRSPDFFNVKRYPTMKFTSDKVHYNQAGEPQQIDGKLLLHGVTNPVTLQVKPVGAGTDPWGGYRAGYNATTTIKRSDYGMKFMLGGVGDEIRIALNIEAIKQ